MSRTIRLRPDTHARLLKAYPNMTWDKRIEAVLSDAVRFGVVHKAIEPAAQALGYFRPCLPKK